MGYEKIYGHWGTPLMTRESWRRYDKDLAAGKTIHHPITGNLITPEEAHKLMADEIAGLEAYAKKTYGEGSWVAGVIIYALIVLFVAGIVYAVLTH